MTNKKTKGKYPLFIPKSPSILYRYNNIAVARLSETSLQSNLLFLAL